MNQFIKPLYLDAECRRYKLDKGPPTLRLLALGLLAWAKSHSVS